VAPLQGKAIGEVLPAAVFSMFVLLFAVGHEAAEEAADFAYETHRDGEEPEEADLGVEQDESALSKPRAGEVPDSVQ